MRALRVRQRHLDFDSNGTLKLAKHLAKTVAKHNYKFVSICGKVFPIEKVSYFMPKSKGYLPIVYLNEAEVYNHLLKVNGETYAYF